MVKTAAANYHFCVPSTFVMNPFDMDTESENTLGNHEAGTMAFKVAVHMLKGDILTCVQD